jgi:formylglycine-generating enzyme required for sulfatase activity
MLGRTVGNYRIVEEIGKGGMGVVYKAVHQKIEAQVVAVKHLAPLLIFGDQCTSERAASEAASQACLKGHPNIVSLYDYVENEAGLFLIMEYIGGVGGVRNLAELIRRRGALPLDELKRLFSQILSAVGFAHKHGIIHRDLKPLNIMLSEFGAKVGDFGIARIISGDTSVSVSGHRVGTPAYMSPEQVLDKKLTRATDIYSLGCTLYEAATGRLPFNASETSSFFEAHLQEQPIPPCSVNPALPEQLEQVILKAMAKKPEDRFQTCEEFATALASTSVIPRPVAEEPPDRTRPEASAPRPPHSSPITPHSSPPSRAPRSALRAVLVVAALVVIAGVVTVAVLAGRFGSESGAPRSSLRTSRSSVSFRPLGRNAQGYEEILWLKDSSVMIRIPAGEFWMGSPKGEGDSDEHPQHKVNLSEYYMDKCEVTNEQFERFVRAQGYVTDAERLGSGYVYDEDSSKWIDKKGVSWRTYYSYATRNHPVVLVSWNDARAYCDWAGKRLPTESEWEKAARGTDARQYPWGNSVPGSSRNGNFADEAAKREFPNWTIVSGYDDGYARTAPVGTYPAGASPYGCMDMAGNVWEWCNDWYDSEYYGRSASNNPTGPSSGSYRVCRGGSWCLIAGYLRCAGRDWYGPSGRDSGLGFRCVRSE